MVDFSGLRCKRLHPAAVKPTKAKIGDAGYDLTSVEAGVLEPGCRGTFKLGFAAEMPFGHYGSIEDRSGLAKHHGLTVLAGTMDNGYRGEWEVVLLNTDSCWPIEIRAGERIAQVVLKRCSDMPVNWVDELQDSERGEGGFGSTGS